MVVLVDLGAVEIGRTPAMVSVIHGNKNRSETMAGVLPISTAPRSMRTITNPHVNKMDEQRKQMQFMVYRCYIDHHFMFSDE